MTDQAIRSRANDGLIFNHFQCTRVKRSQHSVCPPTQRQPTDCNSNSKPANPRGKPANSKHAEQPGGQQSQYGNKEGNSYQHCTALIKLSSFIAFCLLPTTNTAFDKKESY